MNSSFAPGLHEASSNNSEISRNDEMILTLTCAEALSPARVVGCVCLLISRPESFIPEEKVKPLKPESIRAFDSHAQPVKILARGDEQHVPVLPAEADVGGPWFLNGNVL